MIKIDQITLMRGPKILLENASAEIQPGQRAGIIGRNGCGKSSLFALVRGALQVDSGDISVTKTWEIVSVLQEIPAVSMPALEYVVEGDNKVTSIKQQLAQAEAENNGDQIAHLHDLLAIEGGYDIESRAAIILQGLGFQQPELHNPVTAFSGGWRMRLNLARALICRSDLLMLDEPTNHLDLDAVIWLEKWLKQYPGTLMLISHDRDFLDSTVTHILSFEQQALQTYTGNYSSFEKQKAARLRLQQQQYEKQQTKVAHLQGFINRFKAKASKAKQAQSRVKQLAKLEEILPIQQENPFNFEFFEPEKSPNPLIKLEQVQTGYDDKVILNNIHLNLVPGSRIGLLGHNGAGKSTLVKLLASELAPMAGDYAVSQGVNVGYFAQHQAEKLNFDETPLQHIQRMDRKATEQQLRDYLGGFCFRGDDALGKVGPMSGGEKARLVLALIIYRKPNLLLLDEPTNHLDLEMRQALTFALQTYTGAVLLVSHDRYLLNSVCDDFYLVDKGQVELFKGDLADYQKWVMQSDKQAIQPDSTEDTSDSQVKVERVNRKDEKRLKAEFRQQTKGFRDQLSKSEKDMNSLSNKIEALEQRLTETTLYTEENKDELMSVLAQKSDLEKRKEDAEMIWFEAQESLETAQQEFEQDL